jgi:type IV fimbrial biogenesis protein FimT
MLSTVKKSRGFSLIEVLVVLLLVGLLLTLGLPAFSGWMQNLQVRSAADSIQNGLQVARAEAIRRNTLVSFTLNGPDAGWAVAVIDPAESVQTYAAADGAPNAQVGIDPGALPLVVVFDGLGKTNLAAKTTLSVTNPTGGNCGTDAGDMRCLNVTIAVGGQVKMCDPQVVTAGDTRKC